MKTIDRISEKLDERKFLLLAIGIYLTWVVGTYLLEGRIDTLHSGNNMDRFLYATLVNIIIGTSVSGLIILSSYRNGFFKRKDIGISSNKRTIMMTGIVIIISMILFYFQELPSDNPIVLINGFAQVFPTSVAEVFVCWVILGTAIKPYDDGKSKMMTLILIPTSAVLFGVYHYAHSEPFNTHHMVFLLTLIGIGTSIFFYIGKDLYSTILFHNVMATIGVLGSMDVSMMNSPKIPLYLLAAISAGIIIIYSMKIIETANKELKQDKRERGVTA